MPPLPENNTPRVFLDYSDGVNQHTIQFRYDNALSNRDAALAAINDFLVALSPALHVIGVLGARHQPEGSIVTLPVPWEGAASYGELVMPVVNAPRELRFIGRDETGRRVSVSVYGYNGATPSIYRILPGEVVAVDDAIEVLSVKAAALDFVTIASLPPIVYTYASFNFNSYWEEQARP